MALEHYERIIHEWCMVTDMLPWNPAEDAHIEIKGVTVGLIADALGRNLNVYCDLGVMDRPDTHKKLLAMNIDLENKQGSFGMNPHSGALFFRAKIPLNGNADGTTLPLRIASLIESAQQSLCS